MGNCLSAKRALRPRTDEPAALNGGPEPRRELPAEFRSLARYAAQRAVLGQPLPSARLQALQAQEETRLATRAALRVGRGNVAGDIARSAHESSRRADVGRRLAELLRSTRPQAAEAAVAATSVLVEAGNCEEHARLAMFLHAPRLATDQQVQLTTHRGADHAWAEQRPIAGGADAPRQIIDPWTAGSAIEAEDARPEYNSPSRQVRASITAPQAAAEHAGFRAQLAELSQVLPPAIGPMLDALNLVDAQMGAAHVYEERDALHPDFTAAAHAAAARGGAADLAAQLATVAAARGLGASVGGAAQFAREVLDELARAPAPRSTDPSDTHAPRQP